jgi:hypothetical protein
VSIDFYLKPLVAFETGREWMTHAVARDAADWV